MEFLVKNRVFKDFEIEFLPKIEFFDFWPNRVFVKSHKKSLKLHSVSLIRDSRKSFRVQYPLIFQKNSGNCPLKYPLIFSLSGFTSLTPMWRKRTMRPEKIHFPLPTPGTVQEWECFFLLLSIHTLKEGVYGREKKKSISLLHWAKSGERE